MNILMVHPHDLFAKSEPWTIRIESIAQELIKKSHRVKLCYFPLNANTKYPLSNIGAIELFALDRTMSPKAFIVNTARLIKLCRWTDVVHFQKCHHYASVPAALASYITRKPLHYDWDDWEEKIWQESVRGSLHAKFIGIFYKMLERFLPLLSDSVSCASDSLKDIVYSFGIKKEYIFDSPVGADLEKFRPDLDGSRISQKYNINENLILYVGQLHGAQYVDLFIKAANTILHTKPDTRFMIIGEGSLEHKRFITKELHILSLLT